MLSTDVESEEVIEHSVAGSTSFNQVEDLGEFERVFLVLDQQVSWNEANNSLIDARLNVKAYYLMLHVSDWDQLLEDCLNTLELLSFEGKHGLFIVQILQILHNYHIKIGILPVYRYRKDHSSAGRTGCRLWWNLTSLFFCN